MRTRKANVNDMSALLDIGRTMAAESPRYARLRFDEMKLTATLGPLIVQPHGFVWVALDVSKIIGVMVGLVCEHWMSNDRVAQDLALYVAPEHRGSGAADLLVNGFRQWAAGQGAVITQGGVSTGVGTEATARLYERLGWTRCGIILEA